MICPKCGADMHDTSASCTNCGERLIVPETPTAVDVVKKHIMSNNYFLASLFYTLTYVLLLIYSVYCTISSIISFIAYIPALDAANPALTDSLMQSFATPLAIISSMFVSLPIAVTTIIALWLTRKNAKKPDYGMKTGGFTAFKVVLIVNLAILALSMISGIGGMLVLPIGGITLMVAKETVSGIILILSGIIGAVMLIATTAFYIVYYVFAIKSLDSVIKTCKTGVATGKISKFVGVMSYITAGISAVSALALIVVAIVVLFGSGNVFAGTQLSDPFYFIYAISANIFNFIINFCAGRLIFAYKKDIEQFKANSGV